MGTNGRVEALMTMLLLGMITACGGGDSYDGPLPTLSAAEQTYADSFEQKWLDANEEAPEGVDDRVTTDQARCIAVRFINRMGLDRLERYIPSETLGDENDQWGDADIHLQDEEVDWLLKIEDACGVDETALMAAGMAGGSKDLRVCIEEQFVTDLGQRMHELQWGGTAEEYEQVAADFFALVNDKCGDLAPN